MANTCNDGTKEQDTSKYVKLKSILPSTYSSYKCFQLTGPGNMFKF